jgi:hypothetical protein
VLVLNCTVGRPIRAAFDGHEDHLPNIHSTILNNSYSLSHITILDFLQE